MTAPLELAIARIDAWGAPNVACAVVGPDGVLASHGGGSHRSRWASVTKLVTAWVVHIAVERGLLDLHEPAGPPGSTVAHLLAHASGLPFEGATAISPPGRRRIYSNPGYDALGALVAERTGTPFGQTLRSWVLDPLGMPATELVARPSDGLVGPLEDLARFVGELHRPTLVSTATATAARSVAFPGLAGVVPGVGNFDPCDWGLGPELHAGKAPHWMGGRNSPATFGHFGGSGAFAWVDPAADVALAVLADRPFGPWALEAWPPFSDEVLDAIAT